MATLVLSTWVGVADTAAAASSVPTETARRATGALTADDRVKLARLGVANPTSAVVVVRHLARSANGGELARLRSLASAPAQLAPSGACDQILPRGEGQGYCAGHVSTAVGSAPARMPIAASVVEGGPDTLQLVVRNSGPLEVKPLFSWSTVVAPSRLVVAYELAPEPDGWRVTTRVGVEMLAHADSAKQITDTLLKLDAWLTRDLMSR